MGANCVETYCAWILHEPYKGKFDFTGRLNLDSFLTLAERLGLYVVLRPGPYICSECDMGGLPWWLLKKDGIQLRSSDPEYLKETVPYLEKICEIVRPHLYSNGGGVIFLQIENEYGGYGNDKEYLRYLVEFYQNQGMDCAYITSDSEKQIMVHNGSMDGIPEAVNFPRDTKKYLDEMKEEHPGYPNAGMEFWCTDGGNTYGIRAVPRDIQELKKTYEEAMDCLEFVNLYMFHGGSNFGTFAGSDYKYLEKMLLPLRTTYYIGAPLDECGRRTDKYYLFRDIIDRKRWKVSALTAADVKLAAYDDVKPKGQISLADCRDLIAEHRSVGIQPMEKFDQGYGYIVYETKAFAGKQGAKLVLPAVRDMAHVYLDGRYVKSVMRDRENESEILLSGPKEYKIDILVENLGRIKFGPGIEDRKGLLGDLYLYDFGFGIFSKCFRFQCYSYDVSKIPRKYDGKAECNAPAFYRYKLTVGEACDTYMWLKGFTRGYAFVNGFNLGRYWEIEGFDNRFYLPGALLNKGENDIVIFDVLANDFEKDVAFRKNIDQQFSFALKQTDKKSINRRSIL